MLPCCFRGLTAADPQRCLEVHPQKASPCTKSPEVAEHVCAVLSRRQERQPVQDVLSALRCQLATTQGSWLARAHSCVESVLAVCSSVMQASLFGASPCGSVLVLLGSSSITGSSTFCLYPAAQLSPGHVLPLPPTWLGGGIGGYTASAVPAGGVNSVISTSGGLVILGQPARGGGPQQGSLRVVEPEVLVWQEEEEQLFAAACRPATGIATVDAVTPLKCRSSHQPPANHAEQSVPDEWREVLRSMASASAATVCGAVVAGAGKATAAALRAYLVPLRLGVDVIGALLLVTAARPPPPPPSRSLDAAHMAVAEVAAALPPPLSRELLKGVAAAVAECCLGPHLGDIQRVTLAASELASAPDLQGLANCLSTAVTEALASELHVEFAVRLALVPYTQGARGSPQYGFLLTEHPATSAGVPVLAQQQHANGIPGGGGEGGHLSMLSVGGGVGGGAGAVGSELLPGVTTTHGPVSRTAARSLTQQAFAERVLATKVSGGISFGSIPSPDPPSSTSAIGGQTPLPPSQLSLAVLAAGGGGGGLTSGMHSFQLLAGGCSGRRSMSELPSRVWKARPFSLESTLLAALASKATKAASTVTATATATTAPGSALSASPAMTVAAAAAPAAGQGLSFASTLSALSHCALEDGGGPSPLARPAALTATTAGTASYMTVGSSLDGPTYGGGGGGSRVGLRVCRMGGTVVPHVHAYVNDTDQPSGDVVLLLRTAATGSGVTGAGGGGRGVAGGGGGGSGVYAALGGSTAAIGNNGGSGGAGPASLVLVMGSVTLLATDVNRYGGGGAVSLAADPVPDDDAGAMAATVAVPAAAARSPRRGTGTTSPSPPLSLWPSPATARTAGSMGVGGGNSGSGSFDVCLALYLTSNERLPASLLCAARSYAQVLLELLLPAAGACLSDMALEELQYLCEALSGPAAAGGSCGYGGSGLLGRSMSVPFGRQQQCMRTPCSAGDGNSMNQPHAHHLSLSQQPNLNVQQQSSPPLHPVGSTGALASVSAADLTTGAAAGTVKSVISSGFGTMASAPQLLRCGGSRDTVVVAAAAAADSTGGPLEPVEVTDGGQLAQLLMPRTTDNNVTLSTPDNVSTPSTMGLLGMTGLSTIGNCTGFTTLPSPFAVAASAIGRSTRETSEVTPRVTRSRLSAATATVTVTSHQTTLAGTVGASALMNSSNSLVSALMGSCSVTGKAGGGGGGGVTASSTATCEDIPALPSPPLPKQQQQHPQQHPQQQQHQPQQQQPAPAVGVQRRTMRMLQQQQQQQLLLQSHQQHLGSNLMLQRRPPPATLPGMRGPPSPYPGRVHPPPRRHVSDLVATMPLDVSDTLTVMRTNMDILISSFSNTLRSQNTEAAPSPHADEDLRFLRLIKPIGGGACSTVYVGLLHGLEVAVKVMKATVSGDVEDEEDEEGSYGCDAAVVEEEQAESAARRQRHDPQQPPPPQQQQQQQQGEPLVPPAARQAQLRAIMRGARELAVMASISHPNIVQIYSYHTRVLVKYDTEEALGGSRTSSSAAAAAAARGVLPRLKAVAESQLGDIPGPLQTVLIMECCDLGSLADALDSGMFASAIRNAESARWRSGPRRSQTVSLLAAVPGESSGGGGGAAATMTSSSLGLTYGKGGGRSGRAVATVAGGSSMRAIYLTLLEVALALRHLHAMQLVHCDVKPANVLLKSSASDPRGFTCKLTDFGFVNLLKYSVEDADDPQARPSMRYHEPVGTVTHLAPETMVQGSKLDHTVDIFAFGILMWEVYTGKAPYAEHANNDFQDVPYYVVREGLRPTFPASTPLAFKGLAQACWSADVSQRPTAAVLVASLQRLMDTAARG